MKLHIGNCTGFDLPPAIIGLLETHGHEMLERVHAEVDAGAAWDAIVGVIMRGTDGETLVDAGSLDLVDEALAEDGAEGSEDFRANLRKHVSEECFRVLVMNGNEIYALPMKRQFTPLTRGGSA